MIKKKVSLAILAITIVGIAAVSSCKKKTTTTTTTPTPVVDSDQSGSSANSTAESISSDVTSMGSEACDISSSGSLSNYRLDNISNLSCATVTRDTLNKTVTVTFNGGTCLDGRIRTGSLIYNYSNSTNGAKRYRHPGFHLNITSNNYVVDGNAITINNKTISNTTPVGFNPLTTNETWSISASISVTLVGGGSVSWSCDRVKTLLNTSTTYSNAATPITWSMARIGFTGSANGTRSNGETFASSISSQLIRDFGACSIGGRHPFIQGVIIYTPSGKSSRTIDYGNGTCDLNATVTINNVSYPFTLP